MTQTIQIQSSKRMEFIDITSKVNEFLRKSGIEKGAVIVFTRHTTTGITVNENEKGLIADMERTLERLIPKLDYRHDRIDNNADSHLRAMLLEQSIVLSVENKQLDLGTWQRLFFVELDGPRTRNLVIKHI